MRQWRICGVDGIVVGDVDEIVIEEMGEMSEEKIR